MNTPGYNRGHSSAVSNDATPSHRPGTADSRTNPFGEDSIHLSLQDGRSNPFASPLASRPGSSFGASSGRAYGTQFFHSRRVKKGEVAQPWRAIKDPKEKWVTIIPILGLLVGSAIAGYLVYDGIASVTHHKYCPVMSDDFSSGTLNTDFWTQEAEVGGFGYALISKV